MDSSKLGIEKFDGSDFNFWKMQIEDYLYQKGLHEPFTEVKPESMMEEKWKLKDLQALGLIQLTLSRNVAFNVVEVYSRGVTTKYWAFFFSLSLSRSLISFS